MNGARRCIVAVALFAFLAPVARAHASPQAGDDDPGRVVVPDFSVAPPEGGGWYIQRGADNVMFGKQAGSATHTLVASVARQTGFDAARAGFADYATDPQVFAAFAKAATQSVVSAGNAKGAQVRVLEHTAAPSDRFGYCASEYVKSERQVPRQRTPRVQETWGYACLHPTDARVIVQITFSERGLPGEADPSLAQTRERFFSGLRLPIAAAR